MADLLKYPRTPHIEGSRLGKGDEDITQIPFASIAGKEITVEEKCDGANSALSFDEGGGLLLQSRGHYLTGGQRERHYNLLKQWANIHKESFRKVLGDRYIMYGEWMYAKHTVFYDALPHYFLEFDVFDRENKVFLDTPSRRTLLAALPVVSVPVLKTGAFGSLPELLGLITQSRYIKTGHIDRLREYCEKNGLDASLRCNESDPSVLMEGLYIKVERNGTVVDRMKYVRKSFSQYIEQSDSHWLSRPIVPNLLSRPLESLFEQNLSDQAVSADG